MVESAGASKRRGWVLAAAGLGLYLGVAGGGAGWPELRPDRPEISGPPTPARFQRPATLTALRGRAWTDPPPRPSPQRHARGRARPAHAPRAALSLLSQRLRMAAPCARSGGGGARGRESESISECSLNPADSDAESG